MSRSVPLAAAPSQPLRAAIYTRKSSEEGLEQGFNSLHAQREACQAYVLSQAGEGWVALEAEYDDGGYSGGTMERPGLQRLLADVDRGLIDIIVVYKVDRLTRALSDFAKIVERLDTGNVSFVSVTQAFNTTTSMGRLTLNVLLSFAQFEREVTGERIRDKIAASKAKGMWMGGNLPLGYDPGDHTLIINPAEAEQVRSIFTRYLELGSVERLRQELAATGVLSKVTISGRGRRRGGGAYRRGALYHLLQNRIYRGEIVHRDRTYPGLHSEIVPEELFEAVQRSLVAKRRRERRPLSESAGATTLTETWTAPLMGLLSDERGNRMTPTYATRGTRRYRYYITTGSSCADTEKTVRQRVTAEAIEGLVRDRALRLIGGHAEQAPVDSSQGLSSQALWTHLRSILLAVELADAVVSIRMARSAFGPVANNTAELTAILSSRVHPTDQLMMDREGVILIVPALIRRQRGSAIVVSPDRGTPLERQPVDLTLLRALSRAEAWRADLITGRHAGFESIAAAEQLPATYVRRLVRMAFLAPDIKRGIIDGTQPLGLCVDRFMRRELPLLWQDQRALFAN